MMSTASTPNSGPRAVITAGWVLAAVLAAGTLSGCQGPSSAASTPTSTATETKAPTSKSPTPSPSATKADTAGLDAYIKSITVSLPERLDASVTDTEIAQVAATLDVHPVYTTDPNLLTTEKGVLAAFDQLQPQLEKFLNAAHANRNKGPEENAVVHAYRSKLEGLNIDKNAGALVFNELAKLVATDPHIMDTCYIHLPKSKGHGDFDYTAIDKLTFLTGYDGQKVAGGVLNTSPLIVDSLPSSDHVVTIEESKQATQAKIPVQFRLVPAANGQYEIKIV